MRVRSGGRATLVLGEQDSDPVATPDVPTSIILGGMRGIPGPAGPQGPQGAASSGAFYDHVQGVATNVWTIPHNLGFFPAVTVFDNAGDELEGPIIHHISNSSLTLTFAFNVSGQAHLS